MSFLVGAGGTPSPVRETITIVGALILAAVFVRRAAMERIDRASLMFIALLPLLALVQLIPLPSTVWTALPLREAMSAGLGVSGAVDQWAPLSLDPLSTWWSLLSFVPPMVAFLMAASLDAPGRERTLLVVIALGAASAILAGFQQLLGEALFLHPRSIAAGASGFFANQNSQATFLAICVFGLAAMTARSGKVGTTPTIWASLVAGLLAVGTLLSGSRMGFALFIVAALAATCLLAMRRHANIERRRSLAGRIGTAAALAMLTIALVFSDSFDHLLGRFAETENGRLTTIWPDALLLAKEAWPAGTGIGTFVHVFGLVERLDVVDAAFANRAHSDWLEFVIETGTAGVVVALAMTAILFHRIWRDRSKTWDAPRLWALAALGLIALHSLVDYPLRAIALSVVAALAASFLLLPPDEREASHA